MQTEELRTMFKNYKKYKKKIKQLEERIEELETLATKITPTYSKDGSSPSGFSNSKIEGTSIQIVELDYKKRQLIRKVDICNMCLTHCKARQRHLIKLCYINHVPINEVAKIERKHVSTIVGILDRTIEKLASEIGAEE